MLTCGSVRCLFVWLVGCFIFFLGGGGREGGEFFIWRQIDIDSFIFLTLSIVFVIAFGFSYSHY